MTANVISIQSNASLEEADATFRKNKIRHLPVLEGGKLVGILSLTDLKRLSFASNFGDVEANADNAIYDMLTVKEIMMSEPTSIQKTDIIKTAAEILSSKEFHALPVMEGEKLVGIVSTTDLIQYLLSLNKLRLQA